MATLSGVEWIWCHLNGWQLP